MTNDLIEVLRSFRRKQQECQRMSDEEAGNLMQQISEYLNVTADLPQEARDLLASSCNALTALSGRPDMDVDGPDIPGETRFGKPDKAGWSLDRLMAEDQKHGLEV